MKFYVGLFVGVVAGWWLHTYIQTPSSPQPGVPTHSSADSRVLPSAQLKGDGAEQLSSEKLFATLLSLGATEQAMAFLAQANHPEPYRKQLLQYIQSQLEVQNYSRAQALLSQYLQLEFRDVDALLLQAKLLKAQQQNKDAIAMLYQLRAYEHRQAALDANSRLIDQWVNETVASLEQKGDTQAKAQFWQFLIEQEPQRLDYVLALATHYVKQGDKEGARYYLSMLAADSRFESRRQELLQQLAVQVQSGPKDYAVPLQRKGNHYLVRVWLDDSLEATLLIDTGATMTVFRPEVLAQAGYGSNQVLSLRQFNTANGVAEGQVFQLTNFALGQYHLEELAVVGLDLADLQADGLLGMDVLGRFHFQIDQDENKLLLRKK